MLELRDAFVGVASLLLERAPFALHLAQFIFGRAQFVFEQENLRGGIGLLEVGRLMPGARRFQTAGRGQDSGAALVALPLQVGQLKFEGLQFAGGFVNQDLRPRSEVVWLLVVPPKMMPAVEMNSPARVANCRTG